MSIAGFAKEPVEALEACLRDHLGHVLLYLRSPKAKNDCLAAMKEWRRNQLRPTKARRARRSVNCVGCSGGGRWKMWRYMPGGMAPAFMFCAAISCRAAYHFSSARTRVNKSGHRQRTMIAIRVA